LFRHELGCQLNKAETVTEGGQKSLMFFSRRRSKALYRRWYMTISGTPRNPTGLSPAEKPNKDACSKGHPDSKYSKLK
jgi:hypothetical protein